MLIRTGQVAVAIGSIRAYPNGFEFTAHVRMHDEDENGPGWHDPFDRHGRRGRQLPGDVLRLGLLYADGRRGATTGGHWRPDRDDDPGRLVVEHGSSGGTARRWDGNFWVHPLPPDGPVTFVASWPEYGAAETRAGLDGTVIRAAAAGGDLVAGGAGDRTRAPGGRPVAASRSLCIRLTSRARKRNRTARAPRARAHDPLIVRRPGLQCSARRP